jgi:hypothetical protein
MNVSAPDQVREKKPSSRQLTRKLTKDQSDDRVFRRLIEFFGRAGKVFGVFSAAFGPALRWLKMSAHPAGPCGYLLNIAGSQLEGRFSLR